MELNEGESRKKIYLRLHKARDWDGGSTSIRTATPKHSVKRDTEMLQIKVYPCVRMAQSRSRPKSIRGSVGGLGIWCSQVLST